MEKPYLVLARKYRPTNFDELVGQNALVQTLTNAIKTGRIAHAFMLTGIRGVGKTTSARIIAKALNCEQGPTPNPCGVCEQCRSIAEDRNIDVIETDAASKTGVNDIREITDNARYLPVAARYKIYIIDEIHMLSKSAFNALLKTLEEPPPHVKFIFATTEIRKIPLTILSRCQRFDLSRVPVDLLVKKFSEIAEKEGFNIDEEALTLIAKAAEGSVRDGLSLLDQALSRSDGKVGIAQIKEMLGVSDHAKIYELLEFALAGKAEEALNHLRALYNLGSDPIVVLEDLLELVHYVSVAKHGAENSSVIGESDPGRAKDLAQKLSVPVLVRSWQILMRGIGEAKASANSLSTAEMVLIKLCYTAGMPTPDDLLKNYKPEQTPRSTAPTKDFSGMAVIPKQTLEAKSRIANFKQMVDLFALKEEHTLHGWLMTGVHMVAFEPGKFEFRPTPSAPANLAASINKCLNQWTGERWIVAVSNDKGSETVAEKHKADEKIIAQKAAEHPNVKRILEEFPGAAVVAVHPIQNKSHPHPNPPPSKRTGEGISENPPPLEGEGRVGVGRHEILIKGEAK